jgi:hypothetical protein
MDYFRIAEHRLILGGRDVHFGFMAVAQRTLFRTRRTPSR